jgi:phage shock protein C
LHSFVDYQCCGAVTHLQHEVEIPNSWAGKLARNTNSRFRRSGKPLERLHFSEWHSSCCDEGNTICQWSETMEAQEDQIAIPLRSHTILGVCEAIGADFGFNPVFLRVPFAAVVLYSIPLAIGAYFALGGLVLLSRLLFPKPRAKQLNSSEGQSQLPANEQQELAKAA